MQLQTQAAEAAGFLTGTQDFLQAQAALVSLSFDTQFKGE
jgi:hypothetical protein